MSPEKISRYVKPSLLLVFAAFLSISPAPQIQARTANNHTRNLRRIDTKVPNKGDDQLRTTDGSNFRRGRVFRLLNRDTKLKAKSGACLKYCACPASPSPNEVAGWGGCFKGCLADVGVSSYSLILCAGSCYIGVIPICALCVGVSVAVAEVCSLGCAAYPTKSPQLESSRNNEPPRRPRALRAAIGLSRTKAKLARA